jgi:DNA-binding transcriptional regulator YiaG
MIHVGVMSISVKEQASGSGKKSGKLGGKFRTISAAVRARSGGKRLEKPPISLLRTDLNWSRKNLAFVMNASERAIVNWEAGDQISPVYAAKLREIQSLVKELAQLMKPNEIGPWLLTEMEEFEGRTPAELISKGETGRVWASLFYLRSGMPD